MKVVYARNVNEALWIVADEFTRFPSIIEAASSRNGGVLRCTTPVTTVYENPNQRVLFAEWRDANPFFHFMEAMWILRGCEDVDFLERYNRNIRQFSDDGIVFHAPYGYRLRSTGMQDQIYEVLHHMKKYPESRRGVLQIWHADLDLNFDSKDIPCNVILMLAVRDSELDLTICCRSNDVIWGAYGANAVQFSVLQEYLASHLGLKMGKMYQISNDFHIYVDNPAWKRYSELHRLSGRPAEDNCYRFIGDKAVRAQPLFRSITRFDTELDLLLEAGQPSRLHYGCCNAEEDFEEPAIKTMILMDKAYASYKNGKFSDAFEFVHSIPFNDWRRACHEWLERRTR